MISESNLSKQEQLEKLRKGIEYRIEEVTDETFKTERLHNEYTSLCEKFSPKNIQVGVHRNNEQLVEKNK